MAAPHGVESPSAANLRGVGQPCVYGSCSSVTSRPKTPITPGSSQARLDDWEKAGPGRSVVKSTRKRGAEREHVVACRINRELAALGVGSSPVLAMQDACSKLWRASLSSAGEATNPDPKWSRR